MDQLHDPDYRPTPHPPSGDEEREELAKEDLEHEAVVSSDEDEQEDQVDEERASICENAGGLMEGKAIAYPLIFILDVDQLLPSTSSCKAVCRS